ncbi:MAG: hypothetical protein ACRC6A_08450 [Fusobacteriaceae bacterium]
MEKRNSSITFTVSPSLKEALQKEAKDNYITLSTLILKMIDERVVGNECK